MSAYACSCPRPEMRGQGDPSQNGISAPAVMVGAFFAGSYLLGRISCLSHDDRYSCPFVSGALLSSGGMRALSCPSGRARFVGSQKPHTLLENSPAAKRCTVPSTVISYMFMV